jgi:rfaE bifunctional protein kinase chain/domain
MVHPERVAAVLHRFPSLTVAVVGDFFLDKYMVLDPALAERSIETGLEARQVVAIRCSPGAAGTVTNNLSALGAGTIHAIGVTGDDGEGYDLRRGLAATRVLTDRLIPVASRFTPTYTKPMVLHDGHEIEAERLDIKNREPLPADLEDAVIRSLLDVAQGGVDAVLVADQVQERNCGVVTDRVRDAIIALGATVPCLIMADSRERIAEFRNVVVKPNRAEVRAALGLAGTGDAESSSAEAAETGRALAARNGRPVFITLAADGILACTASAATHVHALPTRGEIDIVGAGDSVFAGIACSLASGASPSEAAYIGNLCASVTIHKLGTTGTASPEEILALLG